MYLLIIGVIIIVICILFGDKQENFGCAIISCCKHGEYGTPPNCQKCPDSMPSSPRTANGAPDTFCNCPNKAASSCFACNICQRFNAATGECDAKCSGRTRNCKTAGPKAGKCAA